MIRLTQVKLRALAKKETGEDLAVRLREEVKRRFSLNERDLHSLRIRHHAIDARKKPEVFHVYALDLELEREKGEEAFLKRYGKKGAERAREYSYSFQQEVQRRQEEGGLSPGKRAEGHPVIVGSGPAGLFCAYQLALHGFCPLVLERGEDVDSRCLAVEAFWRDGTLSPQSNVQFGEGGAGTFSDGKLSTSVKDRSGRQQELLKILVEHGADPDILYESKPHIGTDRLVAIVRSIRQEIERRGGRVLFSTKFTGLCRDGEGLCGIFVETARDLAGELSGTGIRIRKEKEGLFFLETAACVLAIGHSARDTFLSLQEFGLAMEAKPFAVGLRVEHSQRKVDAVQYGEELAGFLPPSSYKLTARLPNGRSVYSFCMCPGGYVVNASSEEGLLAVNGMSYHDRGSGRANSAIVVSVGPEDFEGSGVLAGMEFQRSLEKRAYELAGGRIPLQTYGDFKQGFEEDKTGDIVEEDCRERESLAEPFLSDLRLRGEGGAAPLHRLLPPDVSASFIEGMELFGKKIPGFQEDTVIVSGIESRTSSPVRILRGENLHSPGLQGLYPCGEGAGYAGGIASAAMDGMRVAEALAAALEWNGPDKKEGGEADRVI